MCLRNIKSFREQLRLDLYSVSHVLVYCIEKGSLLKINDLEIFLQLLLEDYFLDN